MCTTEKHETVKSNDAEWKQLLYIGIQRIDGRDVLELRNCRVCHSTLARLVP